MAEYKKTFTVCDNCGKSNEDNPEIEWQTLRKEGGSGDYCSEECAEEHWELKNEKHQDETSIPPNIKMLGIRPTIL